MKLAVGWALPGRLGVTVAGHGGWRRSGAGQVFSHGILLMPQEGPSGQTAVLDCRVSATRTRVGPSGQMALLAV